VAIALNETLVGMVTATGTLLFVVVPLPSWLLKFTPQQYAVPIVVKAQVKLKALASIAANETPLGMLTATGTLLGAPFVPLPSWPAELFPQQ
jgi:hypothetical protein